MTAAAPIQSKGSYEENVSSKAIAFDASVAAHSTLVAVFFAWKSSTEYQPAGGATPDCVSTFGNMARIDYVGSGSPAASIYYAYDVTGGACTITWTPAPGGSGWNVNLEIYELRPMTGNADPIDSFFYTESQTTDTPNAYGTGTNTPVQSDTICFTCVSAGSSDINAVTPPGGYTLDSSSVSPAQMSGGIAHKLLSSTSAEAPQWTATRNGGTGNTDAFSCFIKTAAGGTTVTPGVATLTLTSFAPNVVATTSNPSVVFLRR